MASDDGDPSGRGDGNPSNSKGKGREDDDRQERRAGGLLRSVAQSAQASVTPQALSSMLSAGGKAAPAAAGRGVSGEAFEDLQKASGASSGSYGHVQWPQASFRSTNNGNEKQQDLSYHEFADGRSQLDPQLARNFDELQISASTQGAYVGPFTSAAALDRPFHAHVRASISSEHELSQAWHEATSSATELPAAVHDPAYHDIWARSIPAPMFPGRSMTQMPLDASPAMNLSSSDGQDIDFMSALEAEGALERGQRTIGAAPEAVLPDVWRPPSPSQSPTMTQEQYALHRRLAEEQDGDDRADERVQPPDDDEAARTGVYAATPEDALRAIWEGSAEGERASHNVQEIRETRSTDGAEVVRKVRRLLARGSYVDDVYGLPPALVATLEQAEQAETDANGEMRAKAIARLGALYKHLEAAQGTLSSSDVDEFVGRW